MSFGIDQIKRRQVTIVFSSVSLVLSCIFCHLSHASDKFGVHKLNVIRWYFSAMYKKGNGIILSQRKQTQAPGKCLGEKRTRVLHRKPNLNAIMRLLWSVLCRFGIHQTEHYHSKWNFVSSAYEQLKLRDRKWDKWQLFTCSQLDFLRVCLLFFFNVVVQSLTANAGKLTPLHLLWKNWMTIIPHQFRWDQSIHFFVSYYCHEIMA